MFSRTNAQHVGIMVSSVQTADGQIIEPKMSASFVPDHKASMVLFLDRVYGIDNQDFLLHVLEVGFLPDMRASASLDTVRSLKGRFDSMVTARVCTAVSKLFCSGFRWRSVQLKWPWH